MSQYWDDLSQLGIIQYTTFIQTIHHRVKNPLTKDTPDVEFHMFWNGPFSQWDMSDFTISLHEKIWSFNCAEQAMMGFKAMLFEDDEILDQIMKTAVPREQKALGRKVKGTNSPKWDAGDIHRWNMVAEDIIAVVSLAKNLCSESHMKALMNTRGKFLVEASPKDTIWGIGLSEDDPRAQDPKQWLGTNWLGKCVTRSREILVEATPEEKEILWSMTVT